jgi:tetratricopeptide (TPR) repeat protein
MPSNENSNSARSVCPACRFEATDGSTICPKDGVVLIPLFVDPLVDTVLDDRYEILSVIGFGGITAVYKAVDTLKNRTVVVKLMREELSSDTNKLLRFQRGAKAASSLSHPNIVALYDCVVSPAEKCYLVAEYVEGTTLADLVGYQGALKVERGVQIFLQVCDALIHAHDHKIVHRNMKPSNILIASSGEGDLVKLADFGIAKQLVGDGEVGQKITRTGQWVGSPLYMSPEQAQGKPVDARSDVFSLGKVMLEAFRGKLPLLADSISEQSSPSFSSGSQQKIATSHPEYVDPVPAPLRAIIAKAMQKDPKERFQSVRELKKNLEGLTGGRGRADLSFGMRLASWTSRRPPVPRWAIALVIICFGLVGLSFAFAATPAGRIMMTELYIQYREGTGGPSDQTLLVASQLAELYRQNGRIQQAIMEDKKLADLVAQRHGINSIDSAKAYAQLAMDCQSAGERAKAREYNQRVLGILRVLLPPNGDGSDTAKAQELLELEGQLLGKESNEYAEAKICLSLFLLPSAGYSRAQQWLLEIADAPRTVNGRNASLVYAALNQLAGSCIQHGADEQAIAYLKRAQKLLPRLGKGAEFDVSVQCALASIYTKKHELNKAEAALKSALSEASPNSRQAVAAMLALSNLYLQKGELKQSESYASEALILLPADTGFASERSNAMTNLLTCYVMQKDVLRATALAKELAELVDTTRKNDPARIRFYELAGDLSFLKKEWSQSANYFRMALLGLDARNDRPDMRTASCLYKLAACDIFLGRDEAAQSAYERLLELEAQHALSGTPEAHQYIQQIGQMLKLRRERKNKS